MPGSGEVSASSAAVQKLPKFHRREEGETRRRQTVAAPDAVAEALANHSAASAAEHNGVAAVHRELSMHLPSSTAGKREPESELEQVFRKFRRHASEIEQSSETAAATGQNGDDDAQMSIKETQKPVAKQRKSATKPRKPVAKPRKLAASHQSDAVNSSQPDDVESSQPGPAWKSMSCLATDESVVQKPSSSMKTSWTDVDIVTSAEKCPVALTSGLCASHSATSSQAKAACGENPEVSCSTETENDSLHATVAAGTGDKTVTQQSQCTGDVVATSATQSEVTSKPSHDTQSSRPPAVKPKSTALTQTSSSWTDVHKTATTLPKEETATTEPKEELQQSDSSNKNHTSASVSGLADAASSHTACLSPTSIPIVTATPAAKPQQPTAEQQLFQRQKSCPEKAEHDADDAQVQPDGGGSSVAGSNRSDDVTHAVEGLRSCALWAKDNSGNRLEVKLKKSHSLALKPLKDSATAPDASLQGTTDSVQSSHSQTPSTVNISSHPNASPSTKQEKVSVDSSDQMSGEHSLYPHDGLHVTGILGIRRTECIQPLKLSSAIIRGRSDKTPSEPSWLAIARQKTQRWNEYKV